MKNTFGLSARSIRRFGRTLGQAVHDAKHETTGSRRTLIHYWDTDCLYIPVRGFLGFENNQRRDDDLVVQALYSAGFLGSVAVSASHRIELLRQVEHWAAQPRSKGYAHDAENFVKSKDLSALTEVAQIASQADSALTAGTTVDHLRQLDRLTFAYVESLNGPWDQRLTRLLDDHRLELRSPGPSHSEILRDEYFQAFVTGISSLRRNRALMSSAYDAATLAAVARMNQNAISSKDEPLIRFYTASRTLQDFFRTESWVQELFSFPTSKDEDTQGSVWRDSYYYILRAMFPSLCAGSKVEPLPGSPSLEDLTSLVEDLTLTLQLPTVELHDFVSRYRFANGDELVEKIVDLESAGMAQIWHSYDAGSYADRLITGLRSSLNDIRRIERSWGTVSKVLENAGGSIRQEAEEFLAGCEIVKALWDDLARVVPINSSKTVSITYELASIRWGLVMSGREDAFPTILHDDAETYSAIAPLLSIDSVAGSVEKVERFGSILVGLKLFEAAQMLFTRAKAFGTSSESIGLMTTIACIQGIGSERSPTLAELVAGLQKTWSTLSAGSKSRLALGFGYGAFAAWEKTPAHDFLVHPTDEHRWAQWSYDIVNQHIDELDGAAYGFGLNHLVYVGTVCDLGDPLIESRAVELEELTRHRRNFRFLDTIGFRGYLLALRGLRRSRFASLDQWRIEHCGRLREANSTLQRAVSYSWRDSEVVGHHRDAQDFARITGCVNRAF